MTNIMLSTDELMTLWRALERAMNVAAQDAKARGEDPDTSQEYRRIKQLFEKVKDVAK
jgi:hypothetical protein